MRKPMAVTPRKIEANRRNAEKSTGPKTENGKAVSKLNALKHGLLAQSVVVQGHKFRESPREFKKLCQEFYADLAPAGPLEEMLLDQIISLTWRLRRARTAESGEIALSVDEGQWKRSRVHPRLRWMEWDTFGDPVYAMEGSALGNHIMASWLRKVRASVEKEGELTEAVVQSAIFYGKPNSLTKDLEKLRLKLQDNPEGLEVAALRERNKQQVLTYLDKKLEDLFFREEHCSEREDAEERARQSAGMLPSAEVLEKILRYETALERQLFRAMNQLERLQRRRLGENIPAPMTMEISARA